MQFFKKISTALGTIVILGTLISGFVWFDGTYAKAEDVDKNTTNIAINQLRNDIRWYEDQITTIKLRCNERDTDKLPRFAYESAKDYSKYKKELEVKLNILLNKKHGLTKR